MHKYKRLIYSHKCDELRGLNICWRDSRRFFTSLISLTSFSCSMITFTASFNVEDPHDALSSTVDCAYDSKGESIITLIKVAINAVQLAFDIAV